MVSVGPGRPLNVLDDDIMTKLEVEYNRIVKAEKTAFLKGRKEMDDYVKKLAEKATKSEPEASRRNPLAQKEAREARPLTSEKPSKPLKIKREAPKFEIDTFP